MYFGRVKFTPTEYDFTFIPISIVIEKCELKKMSRSYYGKENVFKKRILNLFGKFFRQNLFVFGEVLYFFSVIKFYLVLFKIVLKTGKNLNGSKKNW